MAATEGLEAAPETKAQDDGPSTTSTAPPVGDATMSGVPDTQKDSKKDISEDIDPENEVQGPKLVLINIAICLCTFLVGLDFNLIATAIPSITAEFDSIRDVGWYGSSFMLALCATQPLAGKTYTLFPKKLSYLVYLFVFEVGSLVCALAPSSNALIVGRAVAGLGASGVFAGGFTLLTTIIPLHKRAIWTGIMGSTFAIASIIGPVLAGALTQNVTWRWCFYINLPIGGAGAAIFFVLVHLKPAPTENASLKDKLQSLDAIGFALFAGAMTMLLLALQWGGNGPDHHPWSSSIIIGLLVGAGIVFALFVPWQIYRKDAALVPPRLFAVNRNPALICAAAFFINGPFQIIIYWLPIWFQGVLGVSPTQSGINYFPTVVADVLAAFVGSALVMKIGWWNPFLLVAEALVCVGGGLLSTLNPEISTGHWIGYQIFGGLGYSLASNLSHLAMQSSLPQDLVPIGSSTLLAVISTSCAIFLAIGQAVFIRRIEVNIGSVASSEVVNKIIQSGATDIPNLVDPANLSAVIRQYSKSVTEVFYIPAASPAISFFLLLGCKWISSKSKQKDTSGTKTMASDSEKKEVGKEVV
ncbi:major facilitator superfamily domain-containing protein [Bombardia bombarda]|uniref:Major facilitator superfamily domain-containing protein n=1 Tax=Bombardia bombarda TaxID=252184 RepID=A0AA39XBS5_9PEZI|nr:major facilitator superfamily domain-containing protein [Bombardia bombarda]